MRRKHTCRQVQLYRCLERNYVLSVKQLSSRLKLSIRSIRRYLPILLEHKLIEVRFTEIRGNSKKPTYFYSVIRDESSS